MGVACRPQGHVGTAWESSLLGAGHRWGGEGWHRGREPDEMVIAISRFVMGSSIGFKNLPDTLDVMLHVRGDDHLCSCPD